MKHFIYHTLMCFLSCAVFHLLDIRFGWTASLIKQLAEIGVW